MNRQELLLEIKSILKEFELENVCSEGFLAAKENKYLADAFEQNKKNKGTQKAEKWHQIVRFAAADPLEIEYMYDRLIRLVITHRRNIDSYFKIKSDEASFHMPDRRWDLNRLLILFEDYFSIYRRIIQNIHFEFPSKEYRESYIRGRINWDKTLRKSTTEFPTNFDTSRYTKNFTTPGNTLLVLGALWLNKESRKISNMDFLEPLTEEEKSILETILQNSQIIINSFPFSEVVANARKFINLELGDKRIKELIIDTRNDIINGKIRNKKYLELIKVIQQFQQLNLLFVTEKITNYPLETLENLDTIYEAWIFFEILDYYSRKEKIIEIEISEEPYYFIFEQDKTKVKIIYDHKFSKGEAMAWAVGSKPDFTVLVNDTIIATFDAKNYSKNSWLKSEAIHKILGYMVNLDCGLGALFFPNFKTDVFEFPDGKESFYHYELKVYHYQMKPVGNEDALKIKNETLKSLYEEIRERISKRNPLTRLANN